MGDGGGTPAGLKLTYSLENALGRPYAYCKREYRHLEIARGLEMRKIIGIYAKNETKFLRAQLIEQLLQ